MDLQQTRKAMAQANAKLRKEYLAMDKQIVKDTISYLKDLQKEVRSAMVSAEGFILAHLNAINSDINNALVRFQNKLTTTVSAGQSSAWDLGIRSVDTPLEVAGIGTALPGLSDVKLVTYTGISTDLITGITNDARQQIKNLIQLSVVGEKNVYDTAKAVDRIIGVDQERGVTAKAVKVARTELGRAESASSQLRMEQAAEQVPGLKKQWVTGINPRESHRAADGQIVGIDEPFIVGGYEAMYPHDPNLPPEETCNCNCVSLPVVEEPE